MHRLVPLVVIAAGIALSKMAAAALGIGFEHWLLTALLVAAPLIVLEVRVIDRLPGDLKQYVRMDRTPFPYFTLGVAAGIVLMGRGVI